MIDAFLRRLDKVRKTGKGWTARCPAHEDSAPSLSVSEGADGRVLVYCFAGCSLESITGALGMQPRELFADDAADLAGCTLSALAYRVGIPAATLAEFGVSDDAYNGTPAVAIPYRDDAGAALRTKYRVRLVKGLDGQERFLWGPGQGNWPYGLWRLQKAREKGGLLICEGESDAWSLWAEQVPALGIPGATQAKLLQPEHLTGIRSVWVTRDNDPAGEEFVTALSARLEEIGFTAPLRVVSPPRPHKDVTDWRKAAPATFADELRLALRKAPTVAEMKSPLLWAHRITPRSLRFAFNPYIPKGHLTLLAGKPGMGKTMVACALIAAITNGTTVLGATPEKAGKAILFSAEDDPSQVLVPRLGRAGARMDQVGIHDFEAEDFSLNGDGIKRLEMLIEAERPELIVLDPLVTFLSGGVDMNQANEVRAVLRPLAALAMKTETAILVIAHVKKGSTGDAIDSVIGSMDFMAAVRSALRTYRDPERTRGRQQFVLAHIKHNLTAPGSSLRYEIRPCLDAPSVPELLWIARSRFTVEQLTTGDEDIESVEEATEFLRRELTGPKSIKVIRARAREVGIPDKTLQTARRRLGLVLRRQEDGYGSVDYILEPPTPEFSDEDVL